MKQLGKRTLKQKLGTLLFKMLGLNREVFESLRYEMNAVKLRINNTINPFQRNKVKKNTTEDNLSVNIGAGPFGEEGWVNIDVSYFKNISFTYDCRKRLPFRDDSVARIRCEHCLEHMEKKEEVPIFLKECFRSLKKGGILRIVVPDLYLFMAAYLSDDDKEWVKIGYPKIPQDFNCRMDILNHTFRQGGEHKYGYDFESMKATVGPVGFSMIIKRNYQISEDFLLRNDLENHKNYSLYVDCIK